MAVTHHQCELAGIDPITLGFLRPLLLPLVAGIFSSLAATAEPIGPPTTCAIAYPGPLPGPARLSGESGTIQAGNAALELTWAWTAAGIKLQDLKDRQTGTSISLQGELYQIILADGSRYPASAMIPVGQPHFSDLVPEPRAARLAARIPGRQATLALRSTDGRLAVVWRAVMRDGANHLRQEIAVTPVASACVIKEIRWLDDEIPGAASAGTVDGSPLVAGNFFFGLEDPHATNAIANAAQFGDVSSRHSAAPRVAFCLPRNTPLGIGQTLTTSLVIGVSPSGQLRRAFLYYLEYERAHPYRAFLHYNSWYDISPWHFPASGWDPYAMNEANSLDAIRTFGERLIKPHGVVMDSMVFDEGWDDIDSLWGFHRGFPQGFTPHAALCRQYGTALGAWLSPLGGGVKAKEHRVAFGTAQGYETNAAGLSLAGPKYYAAFKAVCLRMMHEYGVNHFKFDGIARGGTVKSTMAAGAGADFMLDTDALRRLMLELRMENPALFINFTTGSWPSPFWLQHADSVWRQGHDSGSRGEGPPQQRALTYRDSEEFKNIVQRAPLYPLNSLMSGGITYSRHGHPADPTYNSAGLKDDIRSYFGSGTGLLLAVTGFRVQ